MSDFNKAITAAIMAHEVIHTRMGTVVSYQRDPSDKGNYRDGALIGTNWGVSAAAAPKGMLDSIESIAQSQMRNLTLQQAIDKVYQPRYGAFAAIADQRVLTKMVDLAINMEYDTHGPATKILQMAVNTYYYGQGGKLEVDGVFGPDTVSACNSVIDTGIGTLLQDINGAALSYYRKVEAENPGEYGWFNNWDNRAVWTPPVEVAA